jgi:hypothetical protein
MQVHFTVAGKAPSGVQVAYVASTGSSGAGPSRLIVLSHNARLKGRRGFGVARFVDPTVKRYTINAAPRGKGDIGCAIKIGAYSASTGLSSLCVASLRWSARLGHWVTVRPAPHAPTPPHHRPSGPSPLARAFVNPDGSQGGGRPLLAIGIGSLVNFIPSAPFHIGVVFTNSASQAVTLTNVRAVFPHGSVFRQLGTALAAPSRVLGIGCGISKPSSFGVLRPKPLRVVPGKNACVQLNFRLLGCPAARHASLQNVGLVEVSYRTRAGTIVHQRVRLGDSQLEIHPTYEYTLLRHSWARRAIHPCTK